MLSLRAPLPCLLRVGGMVVPPRIRRWQHRCDEPGADTATVVCGVLTLAMLGAMFFDRRQRAPQDWLSGSHLVLLPKPPPKAAAPASNSLFGTGRRIAGSRLDRKSV